MISIGCPSLWSYIYIGDDLSKIPTILERSRNHALHVDIGSSRSRDEIFWRDSGLGRAQERVHTLYSSGDPFSNFTFSIDVGAHFPRLQHLSISKPRCTIDMAMFSNFPKLHTLEIKGGYDEKVEIGFVGLYKISTDGTRQLFESLRTVQLAHCENRALHSLFQAMANGLLPSLTCVSFDDPHLSSGSIIDLHASLLKPIPTIRLKTLSVGLDCAFIGDSIENEQPTYWKEVMSAFRFPDLRELNITSVGLRADANSSVRDWL